MEAILSTLVLNSKPALDRLWSLQIQDGKAKGAWGWYEFDANPYEIPGSRFFGASLAAMALGSTPPEYRAREDIKLRMG